MNTANKKIVKALSDHLIKAFEEFADVEGIITKDGLTYIDALMGCHNFYKRVILDLEHRTQSKMIRNIAIGTLKQALPIEENKIQLIKGVAMECCYINEDGAFCPNLAKYKIIDPKEHYRETYVCEDHKEELKTNDDIIEILK